MRRLLSLLIVLAFAARSIVPAGTMLAAPAGDGFGPSLVICTGQGPMTVSFDADGKPVPSKPVQASHDICVFAASVHAAIEAAPGADVAVTIWRTIAVIKPLTVAPVIRSAQGAPPPARGPPTIS